MRQPPADTDEKLVLALLRSALICAWRCLEQTPELVGSP